MDIRIAGTQLTLLPEKAIYWRENEMLILSDLHLGKAGHFRKHGIPVSRKVHLNDLFILESIIKSMRPKRVLLLGDLFHSLENNEWKDFLNFLDVYYFVDFTLVEGNHDILSEYPASLRVTSYLDLEPFSFSHIKQDSKHYNLSGHIHPGVSIRAKARQSITLPCFYFSENHAVLPAFGQFTGIKKIRPKKEDRVYGIAEGQVIELSQMI